MSPRFSIVIPVLNEAYTINPALAHLENRIRGWDCEVVVVDGHPEATTLKAMAPCRARGVRSPAGRGAQLARGAARTGGETLLFLHADTRLPRGALALVDRAMHREDVVGGAFDLGIDAPGAGFRLIEAMANYRTRLTRIPYGDQAIFLDRCFYERIGGMADLPLMEDVDLMRRVNRAGGAVVLLPRKVRTSARRWQAEGAVRTTLRNWLIMVLYLWGVPPQRLAGFYRTWPGGGKKGKF